MPDNEHPLVHVLVTVNVNNMRRGQELQLPLTEQLEGLSLAGYVQILGHVYPPAPEPVAELPADTFTNQLVDGWADTVAVLATPPRAKKSRRRSTEVDDGGSESPA